MKRCFYTYFVSSAKSYHVSVLLEMGNVTSGHGIAEGGHVGDGGPAVLAHPPPAAAAVAVDGHLRRAVVGVVGRALVRVVPETVGTHHSAHRGH